MASTFDALKSDDIRSRLGWVFFGLAIFVLVVHVGMPGINKEVWNALLSKGELFKFLGMFTGGALNNFSVAAMGITPYINASIIMQLLTVVLPQLKELQKEGGEQGRREIGRYTRYLTLGLAALQAVFMTVSLARIDNGHSGVFTMSGVGFYVMLVLALVSGTMFLMWLGELMTEKGIGNGISMLIFGGIVLRFPDYLKTSLQVANIQGATYYLALIIFAIILIALVAGIIFIHLGMRKIPIQYPRRQVGNKMYGGQTSYLPIRVNNAGVISIIFAISIMYLPNTIAQVSNAMWGANHPAVAEFAQNVERIFAPHGFTYNLCYAALVIFFTYFYSAITFNVNDVADNLKKGGGFIPGIRPGRPTAEYLERVFSRLTFISSIFLAFLAVAPTYIMQLTKVNTFFLGSTSLLIIVGVALDVMQQIQARLTLRHYQGFMK
ncbi:preprotein translocase subunit SecY [bacterium]|nr:preprotein translocase subunit SecY [bacterium]